MPKKSVKKFLISYTGKMPEEVDFEGYILARVKNAKRKKLDYDPESFERLAIDRSGSLTLRRNNTAIVSSSELEAVKDVFGELKFKRFIVEHGEYNPRSERPKEEAAPEPKSKPEVSTSVDLSTVTVKGKKKGKG